MMQDLSPLSKQASDLAKKAVVIAKKGDHLSAIEINLDCLKLKKKISDDEGVAFCYDRLSGIYWRLCQRSKDTHEKLQFSKYAYDYAKLALNSGYRTDNRIINIIKMAELYGQQFLSLERFKDATTYFLESLAYNAVSNGALDKKCYVFSCFRLMYIYAKQAWTATQQEQSMEMTVVLYRKAYEYGCLAKEASSYGEEEEQLSLLSKITHDYAKCLEELGDWQIAIDVLERNFLLNRELGKKQVEWITRDKIASIYFRVGDLFKAKLIFENLIYEKEIQDKVVYDHSRHMLAAIYDNLGHKAQKEGGFNKAKYYLERFLKLSQMNNDVRKTAEAKVRLAFFYLKKPDYQKSYTFFCQGFEEFLAFLDKREGFDFKTKLSDSSQDRLLDAKEYAQTNDFKSGALCYAKVWDELAEKSKPEDKFKHIKRKSQELIQSARQKMMRDDYNANDSTGSSVNQTRMSGSNC